MWGGNFLKCPFSFYYILISVFICSHLLGSHLYSTNGIMVCVLNIGSLPVCGFPQEKQILLKKMAQCANICLFHCVCLIHILLQLFGARQNWSMIVTVETCYRTTLMIYFHPFAHATNGSLYNLVPICVSSLLRLPINCVEWHNLFTNYSIWVVVLTYYLIAFISYLML